MSGFILEGLKIRYREKPINEDSNYSNQLENSIDIKDEPHIFLHNDGRLYVKDNTSLSPVDIAKFNKPFNSLVVEDGILNFVKNDGTESLTLSDLTTNKSSIIRDNSLIFSKTKEVDIEETNILDKLRSFYFEENSAQSLDISGSDAKYVTLVSEVNGFSTTVNSKLSNSVLRSSSSTILDTYITNYVYGYTTTETAVSGISGEYYKTYNSTTPYSSIDIFPTTLRTMEYFINDSSIGFNIKENDLPSKYIFVGKKLSEFKEYLYSNLIKYDGTYSFMSSILGDLGYTGTTFSMSTSGEAISASYIGEYDNGYTTINGGDVLSSPLDIDAGGLFSTLSNANELQPKLIKQLSISIFTIMFDKISDTIEAYFRSQSMLDGNDIFINPLSDISIPAILTNLQNTLINDISTIKSNIVSIVNVALSNDYYSVILNNNEVILGGVTDKTQAMITPLQTLNNNWFDIDDLYITTNRVDNKKAISCSSNFLVNVRETDMPLTIEFRLYESVSSVVLDTSRINTISNDPKNYIGLPLSRREYVVPVELNYFGPITQYDCRESLDEILEDNDLNIGEHIRLYSSSNCANDICLTDEGNALKQIVDDIFSGSDSEIIKQNESKINVPRIFKVQWRVIAPSNIEVPQIEDFDVFRIVKTSDSEVGESRIGVSIFSIGDTSGKRSVIKGTKKLDNSKAIQVLFDRSMPSNNYSVTLSKNKNVKLWIDRKTTNGFTIYADKKISCEINWVANYQPQELSIQATGILPNCFVDNEVELGNKTNFDILKQEGFL